MKPLILFLVLSCTGCVSQSAFDRLSHKLDSVIVDHEIDRVRIETKQETMSRQLSMSMKAILELKGIE